MEVVVVVALGVDSQDEYASVTKHPIKEFFTGENLKVIVSTRHPSNLVVRELIKKETDAEPADNEWKILAIFKNWEYYRITK